MDAPKILAIKDDDNQKAKYHHPHLPDVGVGVKGKGSCLLLLSPRQTGKSTVASNLFLNPAFFGEKANGEKFFDEIYVISPTINLDRSSRFLKKRCVCFDTYHPDIKLLAVSSQKFRGALNPILRANITDLIVGSPFPNTRDLSAVAEEFGDQFGGMDKWLELYKKATPKKYDFAYMKLTNPPQMFHNFEEQIY